MQHYKGCRPIPFYDFRDMKSCPKCDHYARGHLKFYWSLRYTEGCDEDCIGGTDGYGHAIPEYPCLAKGEHLVVTCAKCEFTLRVQTHDHEEPTLGSKLRVTIEGEEFVGEGEFLTDKKDAVRKIIEFAGS